MPAQELDANSPQANDRCTFDLEATRARLLRRFINLDEAELGGLWHLDRMVRAKRRREPYSLEGRFSDWFAWAAP
jgi:hypothetical protein